MRTALEATMQALAVEDDEFVGGSDYGFWIGRVYLPSRQHVTEALATVQDVTEIYGVPEIEPGFYLVETDDRGFVIVYHFDTRELADRAFEDEQDRYSDWYNAEDFD